MDTEEPVPSPKVRKLRRDRNAGLQMDHVQVPTASDLPYYAGVGLAQALIKHILFIRQQIPMPYDQLRSQIKVQEEEVSSQRSRRPNSYIRKARKLVEATDSILDGMVQVMARSRVVGILVSLGPTPINPKEAFILRFDANAIPIGQDNKPAKDPSRQMIRQMVTSGLEQFDKPALPQKLFVLVLVAADTTWAAARGADLEIPPAMQMPSTAGEEAAASRWMGGWTARHGFTPKLRRCRPVGVSVGAAPFCEEVFPAALTGEGARGGEGMEAELEHLGQMRLGGEGGNGLVWLQHAACVRGLPHETGGGGL